MVVVVTVKVGALVMVLVTLKVTVNVVIGTTEQHCRQWGCRFLKLLPPSQCAAITTLG